MSHGAPENRRVLIVDDNSAIHDDFKKILCSGNDLCELNAQEAALFGEAVPPSATPDFELTSAFQGNDAVAIVAEAMHAEQPFALAFVDMRMPPGWDGLMTIQHLWEIDPRLHIVICTAYTDYTSGQILQQLGQTDRLLILKKPFEPDEIRLAAVTMTKKWHQAIAAQQKTDQLQRQVALKTSDVEQTRDAMLFALAQLAESRDTETGQHLDRMREYSQILARQLASDSPYADQIDQSFLDDLYRCSPLHDIGKVGVPDAILQKPGRLTPEEYELMKQHVAIGTNTIRQAIDRIKSKSLLQMAADVVEFHHERFDGTGYLQGLRGEAIPLAARIVSLADVFDAISSKRVYKDAIAPDQTRQIIISQRGKHFDPVIVEAFLQCYDRFLQVGGFETASEPQLLKA
ncbi:MAG: HD domain-containing protein [Pirellulales bacterium]|nr:HD domain-containing protein [Pirellulales bacterium]